ncbi:MAG: lipoprotein insertase outer membrane protein LolB [Gammaproteobacteria bacterium]
MRHSERSEQAWTARRAQLAQIDRFTLQARVSSGGMFGVKGNLNWEQAPEAFDMRVAGPFGIGAATITGRGRLVEIKTARRSFTTQDPEGDLKARLGWTFPVSHLRYWVLGQPAPGSAAEFELDRDGRIASLEQDGWTLEFSEYQDAGALELPRKFEVANDELRLKVVVDAWSGLPALK